MNFSIRQLTEQDAVAYRELRLESLQEAPYAFSSSYEEEALYSLEHFAAWLKPLGSPPESYVLGAYTDAHALVGTITFKRDTRLKARHKSMIYAMYTQASTRGHGVGKALVEEVIQRAKKMEGLEQIHLWVLHSTTSAANFYKKCGFQGQGPLVKNDLKIRDRYVDAEYMVLYLAE
ncbi:GNAT family N-acetyltransferase [Cesiribacter sp. SM1]|uniref:GNAT family N-acetyltransferase n=1 Tax=Cesiribacter sp. SM1 TaxID=2861196 RepID=UPI001CD34F5E|nr:GNAT family N-acetyltransferase [Cesiribacter sp. SM1]